VFFYNVGDRLDIERIASHATAMGLGQVTGIDLPGEDPGLIPTTAWKRSAYSEPWYPGETISVSIGQGAVSVTPLQITWALGGLAVGGALVEPHLVAPSGGGAHPEVRSYPVDSQTLAIIRSALWDVVNGGGTGSAARVTGFDVAGKTGTAQVVGRAAYGSSAAYEDHAWFVGFAPYDNPEIAVGVFVENGGHGGSAAGPVAQAVFQAWFDKTRGVITQNVPLAEATASD
jgi:penicillin-binding protein 2